MEKCELLNLTDKTELIKIIDEHITSFEKINVKTGESYGFTEGPCIKYFYKDKFLCALFPTNDSFSIFIDLLISKTKDIKNESLYLTRSLSNGRIVNNRIWINYKIMDNSLIEEAIDIIDLKYSYLKSEINESDKYKVSRKIYLTGEDIDMFNERIYDEKQNSRKNICDSHEDGA